MTETGVEPPRTEAAEAAEALSCDDGETSEGAEVLVWNGLVARPSERPRRVRSNTC